MSELLAEFVVHLAASRAGPKVAMSPGRHRIEFGAGA
jgi:hypothetical protein